MKISTKEKKNNELEECINIIFSKITNCKDDGKELTKNTDAEAVEVILDDYNYTITTNAEEGATNATARNNVSINKLGLSNVFDQRNAKLAEMKIPLVRERKKDETITHFLS